MGCAVMARSKLLQFVGVTQQSKVCQFTGERNLCWVFPQSNNRTIWQWRHRRRGFELAGIYYHIVAAVGYVVFSISNEELTIRRSSSGVCILGDGLITDSLLDTGSIPVSNLNECADVVLQSLRRFNPELLAGVVGSDLLWERAAELVLHPRNTFQQINPADSAYVERPYRVEHGSN